MRIELFERPGASLSADLQKLAGKYEGSYLLKRALIEWLENTRTALVLNIKTPGIFFKSNPSGELANSFFTEARILSDGVVVGELYSNSSHARIHDQPGITTITPKRAKWLTVPLDAAKTRTGKVRGRARDFEAKYPGGTEIIKDKDSGRFFIIGKTGKIQRSGENQGEEKIVYLFILAKSVDIQGNQYLEKTVENAPDLDEFIRKAIAELLA